VIELRLRPKEKCKLKIANNIIYEIHMQVENKCRRRLKNSSFIKNLSLQSLLNKITIIKSY